MGVDALGGWGHGVAGGGDVVFFFVGLERRLASKMLPPSTGLKIRLKSKYLHLQTYGINIGTNRRYPKAFSQHRRLYTNLDRVFLNLLFFLSRVISPAALIKSNRHFLPSTLQYIFFYNGLFFPYVCPEYASLSVSWDWSQWLVRCLPIVTLLFLPVDSSHYYCHCLFIFLMLLPCDIDSHILSLLIAFTNLSAFSFSGISECARGPQMWHFPLD